MTSDQAQQFSALPWVRSLVGETLQQARRILEDHVDGIEGEEGMDACVQYLHQINGALVVSQIYGAAMLADEMEQVARGLAAGSISRKDDAAEVLMLGVVQLPAYLERIESGEPDIPLILMPLLNDLRAAREAPLVSEISLFAPKLDQLLASEEVVIGSGNPELPQEVRNRRSAYHKALLGWYKGDDPAGALRDLRDLLGALSSQAGTARVRRVIDAADALLVAIIEETVETSIAVKLLFGRLDRFLKTVIDSGEEAAAREFPAELLKNLLYYVARSSSHNPVIEAVRQSADLANSFPVSEADLEVTGDSTLMGPGKDLFAAVSDALSHDLTGIKDDLDLYLRGDRSDVSRLIALADPLQKVADTLGMVGRGDLRTPLKTHSDRLRDMAGPEDTPDDDSLMRMASDILRVESALSGLTPPRASDGESEFVEESSILSDAEMVGHTNSAIQESFVELAKIKESVSHYLKDPVNPEPLGDVPARLHGVAGVLRILDQMEAADQLDRLGAYLRAVSDGETEAPDAAQRESLADLMTGVEYYLEAVIEDRPSRQEILDFSRAAAERLGAAAPQGDLSAEVAAAVEPQTEPTATAEPQLAPEDKPALDEVDEEILDIFIEEAREELENIATQYPRWRDEQADTQALQTMRRSFHTLKGSGRLVGAKTIGEFGWAIENLLNRVIDGRIKASAELFSVLDETCQALPELIDAQERGVAPAVDVAPLEARAFSLAEGRQEAAEQSAEEPVSEEPVSEISEELPSDFLVQETVFTEPVTEPEPELETEPEHEPLEEISVLDLEDLEESAPTEEVMQLEVSEADLQELDSLGTESEEISLDVLPVDEVADVTAEAPVEESSETEGEGEEPAEADLSDAPLVLDPVLLDIFRNESTGHLSTIDQFIRQAKDKPGGSTFDEDLRRALHTLRGSAHMAEVEPVAEVAGRMENLVNLHNQRADRTDSTSLAWLQEGRDCLQATVDAINVPGASLPDWAALADRLQQRIDDLELEPESVPTESIDAASMELETEVLEIFAEEAKELVERVEEEFSAWREAPNDTTPVAELQRILHTLKGGARLAGVTPVGDLTHALESLFETVAAGHVPTTPGMQRLVRSALDQVTSGTELLNAGEIPPAEPELIERLESAARGEWLEEPSTLLQSEMRAFDMESIPTGMSSQLVEEEAAEELEAETEPEVPGEDQEEVVLEAEDLLESEEILASEDMLESEDESTSDMVELLGEDELSSELTMDDSTLLGDSQLLTDSELLADSSQLTEESELEGEAARIIPFPGGDKGEAGQESQLVERIPLPAEEPEEAPAASQERVRVRSDMLDQLVNNAGEISIYRARMEQQGTVVNFNLQELNATIARLREQLRQLDAETEAQILSTYQREHGDDAAADFDPLEMDQYSTIQQLSRALVETVTDLGSIGEALEDLNRDSDTLLLQQSRISNDLQDALLRTRMMPFANRVARLQRVVRQAAEDTGKVAELEVMGASGEMDRTILDRMMGPLEHILRNAVAHGIEELAERTAIGKPEAGRVTLSLYRDGADVVLEVEDDGAGMDKDAIRDRAIERGLLDADAEVEDDDLYQFIVQPGFTTAAEVSQVAGRGVGMDAVLSEIKQLGGNLDIHSEQGKGSRFTVRLPFTLAIAQALLVTSGEDIYAVPHTNVEAIIRMPRAELEEAYCGQGQHVEYNDHQYEIRHLGTVLGTGAPYLPEDKRYLPVLLVRSGEHRVAVHVDGLLGNRQIVVKPLGTQLSTVRWFTGGTILADGQVALILDMTALVRLDAVHHVEPEEVVEEEAAPEGVTIMVVDDSITVRKVTSRLLERHDMNVITAKDGVDALAMLQENRPDVMLLDIEMPRMDGFEVARHMQNSEDYNNIPIIMITSRTGDKHRNRAMELGVRTYLGKPYQEAELLDNIYTLLAEVGK